MSFNSGGGNTDFADFGSHPSDCYQDPSPAVCPDGVSVMISVYVRETAGDKFIAGTDTPFNLRGFEIFLSGNEIRCSFYTSNQRYEVTPGFVISVDGMSFLEQKYMESKSILSFAEKRFSKMF